MLPSRTLPHSFSAAALLTVSLAFTLGCMGESMQDKVKRMAETRRLANLDNEKARAENESEAAAESPASPKPDPNAVEKAESESVAADRTTKDRPPAGEHPVGAKTDSSAQSESMAASSQDAANADDSAVLVSRADKPDQTLENLADPKLPTSRTPVLSSLEDRSLVRIDAPKSIVVYRGENESVNVHNLSNDKPIRQFSAEGFSATAIDIDKRQNKVLLGGMDGTVRSFAIDALDGVDNFQRERIVLEERSKSLTAHESPVTAIAVRQSDGVVLTADAKGLMRMWADVRNDSVQFGGNDAPAKDIYAYDGGNSVLAATSDGRILTWQRGKDSTSTEPTLFASLDAEPSRMRRGSDGKGLVVGDEHGKVVAWISKNGKLEEQRLRAHHDAITGVALTDDGRRLITASQSGGLSIWPLPMEKPTSFKTAESGSDVLCSDASGDRVAVRSAKRNLDVYRSADGKPIRRYRIPETSKESEVTSAAFSSDGNWIFVGDSKGFANLFFSERPDPIGRIKIGDSKVTQMIAGTSNANLPNEDVKATGSQGRPSGSICAIATSDGHVGVVPFPRVENALQTISQPLRLVSMDAESGTVAGVSPDGRSLQWNDVNQSAERSTIELSLSGDEPTAISTKGPLVVLGTKAGKLFLWNSGRSENNPRLINNVAHDSPVVAVAITEAGSFLSCSAGGQVFVSDVDGAKSEQRFSVGSEIGQVISSAGRLLAVSGAEATLFDKNGQHRGDVKIPDDAVIVASALSRNGMLAAVLDDKKRLWTFGNSIKAKPISISMNRPPKDLCVAEDGRTVVITDGSSLSIVDLQERRVTTELSPGIKVHHVMTADQSRVTVHDGKGQVQRIAYAQPRWMTNTKQSIVDGDLNVAASQLLCVTIGGDLIDIDVESGAVTANVKSGIDDVVEVICRPNNKRAVVLTKNGLLRLYDPTLDKPSLIDGPFQTPGALSRLAVSPGAGRLAALHNQNQILVWNLGEAEQQPSSISLDFQAQELCFVDAQSLVTTSRGDTLLRTIPSNSGRRIIEVPGNSITDFVVFPDQSGAAVADGGETVHLLGLVGNSRETVSAEDMYFDRLDVHPRGIRLAAVGGSSSEDGCFAIWDTTTRELVKKTKLEGTGRKIAYSADGSRVAVLVGDQVVQVRDGLTGELAEAVEAEQKLTSIAFDSDGQKLILAQENGKIAIRRLASLGSIDTQTEGVTHLSFAAHNHAISGGMNGELKFWNLGRLEQKPTLLQGPSDGKLVDLAVSSDGERVLAVFDDPEHQACLWRVDSILDADGAEPPGVVIKSETSNSGGYLTADGKHILVGGANGTLVAWTIEEQKPIAKFERHRLSITEVDVSSDGKTVFTGGPDLSIRRWSYPDAASRNQKPKPRIGSRQRPRAPQEELPRGELVSSTQLQPPAGDAEASIAGVTDPLDEVRQRLVEGSSSVVDGAIFDLFPSDSQTRESVKKGLDSLMRMQQSVRKLGGATDEQLLAIGKAKRGFFDTRRKLAGAANGGELSFSAGHKNLIFEAETNYKFESRQNRPIKLTIAEDRYVYAARASAPRSRNGEGDGSLASWDFGYSGVKTHDWSSVGLDVKALYASPDGRAIFTVPDLFVFGHDGHSHPIASGARWAVSPRDVYSGDYLFAVGTQGAVRAEEVIFRIYGGKQLLIDAAAPLSEFSAYEGVVTAMAFAKQHRRIAFCVRERASHRLYLADPGNMNVESFELVDEKQYRQPYLIELDDDGGRSSRQQQGSPGVTALAFSPDDKLLVAYGEYGDKKPRFEMWGLDWNPKRESYEGKSGLKVQQTFDPWEPVKGTVYQGSGYQDHNSGSIRFIHPKKRKRSSDASARMRSSSSSDTIVYATSRALQVLNIRNRKLIREIPLPAKQLGRPQYDISEDGRWVIIGDDNGTIEIIDLVDGKKTSLTSDGRPAHAGPVVGVTLSEPDPAIGFPAYAATVGEENRLKVWDLILPFTTPEASTSMPNLLLQARQKR